jgi:hypothetical protein
MSRSRRGQAGRVASGLVTVTVSSTLILIRLDEDRSPRATANSCDPAVKGRAGMAVYPAEQDGVLHGLAHLRTGHLKNGAFCPDNSSPITR